MDWKTQTTGPQELPFRRRGHSNGGCSSGYGRPRTWNEPMTIGIGFDDCTDIAIALYQQLNIVAQCGQVDSGECALDIRRRCGMHLSQLTETTV